MFKEEHKPQEEKPTGPTYRHGCIAHGCPLPGTMSDSIKGAYSATCRYHFAEKNSGEWSVMTQRIRKNLKLLQAIQRYKNAPAIDISMRHQFMLDWFNRQGLSLSAEDSRGDNLEKLNVFVNDQIRGDRVAKFEPRTLAAEQVPDMQKASDYEIKKMGDIA